LRVRIQLPVYGLNLSKKESDSKTQSGKKSKAKFSRKAKVKKRKTSKIIRKKGSPGAYKGKKKNSDRTRVTKAGTGFNPGKFVVKKPFLKKPKNFARKRKIETELIPDMNRFGSFDDIVKMSEGDLTIPDVDQAKRSLKFTDSIPVSLRFFVDANLIRDNKITSADITLEKPRTTRGTTRNRNIVTSPSVDRSFYERQADNSEKSIIGRRYVGFENIYDLKEDIEYKVYLSKQQLKAVQTLPELHFGNIKSSRVKIPSIVKSSPLLQTKGYSSQFKDWRKGKGRDPGDQINKSPAISPAQGVLGDPRSLLKTVGASFGIQVGNVLSRSGLPTGAFIGTNKMSPAAASLSVVTSPEVQRNFLKIKSKLIPIVVNFYIKNPKYINNIVARISLKSKNSLGEQVVAIGSRAYSIDRRMRACLLPITPPDIKAQPLGSGNVKIDIVQKDYLGTHATIYAKFLDADGETVVGWTKQKTVECREATTTFMNFSSFRHTFVCLRAVGVNGMGKTSSYTSAQCKNARPIIRAGLEENYASFRKMPTVYARQEKYGARVYLENLESSGKVTVYREDLSTGKTHKAYSATLSGKGSTFFSDRSVKVGSVYRYYAVYDISEPIPNFKTSYKDCVYKHRLLDETAQSLNLSIRGSQTSNGTSSSLRDDSVSISLGLNPSTEGLKSVLEVLRNEEVDNLNSEDQKSAINSLEDFYAIRATRIDSLTGERVLFDFVPLNVSDNRVLVSDSPGTRQKSDNRNALPPIPGRKYIYKIKLYRTSVEDLMGKESEASIQIERPIGNLSKITGVERRFFKDESSSRGIMRSEGFVKNDRNYSKRSLSYSRNCTGVELTTTVKIPVSKNKIVNVDIDSVSNQFDILTWEYTGRVVDLDHFVILEKSQDRCVPVGAKHIDDDSHRFSFNLVNSDPTYDRHYIIRAYDDEGEVIAEEASDDKELEYPFNIEVLKNMFGRIR